MKQEKLKKITVLNTIFEKDIMQQVLADNDIPAVFRSYEDTAYGELFQSQKGWGSLWAEAQYEEQIQEFLADIRKQQAETPVEGADLEEVDEAALEEMDRDSGK